MPAIARSKRPLAAAQAEALAYITGRLLAAMPGSALVAPGGLLRARRAEFRAILRQLEGLQAHAERLNGRRKRER